MSRSLGLSDPVRAYVQRYGAREHPVLARCRTETDSMPNAMMQISPEQGAFMQTMAYAIHARRAIEVGVFTGYSSTAVALASGGESSPRTACRFDPNGSASQTTTSRPSCAKKTPRLTASNVLPTPPRPPPTAMMRRERIPPKPPSGGGSGGKLGGGGRVSSGGRKAGRP